MTCVMDFVPALAATATQLARVVGSEIPRRSDCGSERAPLRMNWVAVTDIRGNRRLEMHWVLPAHERSSCPASPAK
jgi:hypothetical protein